MHNKQIRTFLVHPCCMSRIQDLRRGRYALLLVLAGRPGTGKTTLGKLLTAELGAAYLRADATHTQRAAWRPVAIPEGADLLMVETTLSDPEEHPRRVNERQGESEGYLGPLWDSIQTYPYDPWDEARNGPHLVVDMSDARAGLRVVMSRVRELRNRLDVAAPKERLINQTPAFSLMAMSGRFQRKPA